MIGKMKEILLGKLSHNYITHMNLSIQYFNIAGLNLIISKYCGADFLSLKMFRCLTIKMIHPKRIEGNC